VFDGLACNHFLDLPMNNDWLHSVCLLSDAAAMLSDSARAALLYDLLRPYDWAVVDDVQLSLGAVARFLGLLATTQSRWDEAAASFERALEINRHMWARPWTAHTEFEFARMLVQRGAPGDRQRALWLLGSVLAASGKLGTRALGLKVAAQLSALDVN
jgi:hypothetical protein